MIRIQILEIKNFILKTILNGETNYAKIQELH